MIQMTLTIMVVVTVVLLACTPVVDAGRPNASSADQCFPFWKTYWVRHFCQTDGSVHNDDCSAACKDAHDEKVSDCIRECSARCDDLNGPPCNSCEARATRVAQLYFCQ